jgi:phosphatidylinositol-3-phosphatase
LTALRGRVGFNGLVRRGGLIGAVLIVVLLAAGCGSGTTPVASTAGQGTGGSAPGGTTAGGSGTGQTGGSARAGSDGVPRPDHIVVAMFENHGFGQVIGSASAPYLNRLATEGALLTDSHGVTHPSQPDYIALFSGSTHGVTNDSCPHDFSGTDNLGSQLIGAGLTFTGYSEGLPAAGFRGCTGGDRYARKHSPWVDFTALPTSVNLPFTDFPQDYANLPTVSFVIPNLCDDMHDCPVSTGDGWLRSRLDQYVQWALSHNSVLIVSWDEDEGNNPANGGGHIPTLIVGGPVQAGARYDGTVDHYGMLRTIEAAYGLPGLGIAAQRTPVTGIWR